jgi:hypothetical protein
MGLRGMLHVSMLACCCAMACEVPHRESGSRSAFIAVVRYYYEAPFFRFFLEWYSRLGFDFLVINNDPGGDPPLFSEYRGRLTSVSGRELANPNSDRALANLTRRARDIPGAQWVLITDPDEFLVLNEPTIQEYVARQQAAHGCLDAIVFRWAVLQWHEPYCAPAANAPSLAQMASSASLAINPQSKTLARIDRVKQWGVHTAHFKDVASSRALIDGELQLGQKLVQQYPFWNHSYSSAAIVHLYVRSLSNIVFKALRTTRTPDGDGRNQTQGPADRELLLRLLRGERIPPLLASAERRLISWVLRKRRDGYAFDFTRTVGYRARFAFLYLRQGASYLSRLGHPPRYVAQRLQHLFVRGGLSAMRSTVCDREAERADVERLLAQEGVPIERYDRVIRAVSNDLKGVVWD